MQDGQIAMTTPILKRVGLVLLTVGLIAVPFAYYLGAWWGCSALAIGVMAIIAAISLLRVGLTAAGYVWTIMTFMLGATVIALIAPLVLRPLDLTITEFRLEPALFLWPSLTAIVVVCVQLWIVWMLGREPVQAAIGKAGSWRGNSRISLQAGGGVAALAGFLLWLSLHGQTAQLAESLALQQLGPGYRYSLTWISSSGNGRGTSVSGVVTAWNDKEIKKVLLRWETP
jgi:hypothetical protein